MVNLVNRQKDKTAQFFGQGSDNWTDIADFTSFAKNWWHPTGPMAPLHKINPLRVLYLDTHISLQGKKLLDVGCGGGLFSEAMAQRGAKVTGIDPSEDLIAAAISHSKENNLTINYQSISAEQLVKRTKSTQLYDVVSCLEVLEHTNTPASLINESAKLLNPGGWAYFSTINKTALAFLQAIVGAEYIIGWLPKGTHSYDYFIKPSQLCDWLEACGLVPMHIKGISFNLLSGKFNLSNQVHTNYLILAHKPAT